MPRKARKEAKKTASSYDEGATSLTLQEDPIPEPPEENASSNANEDDQPYTVSRSPDNEVGVNVL